MSTSGVARQSFPFVTVGISYGTSRLSLRGLDAQQGAAEGSKRKTQRVSADVSQVRSASADTRRIVELLLVVFLQFGGNRRQGSKQAVGPVGARGEEQSTTRTG